MGLRSNIGRETRVLSVEISVEEQAERGKDLARALHALRDLENERKAQAKQAGADIAEAEKEIIRLRDVVASGKESREIEVEIWGEHETGMVHYTRVDTGEDVEARAMTAEELQMPFDFVGPPATGGVEPRQIGPDREQLDGETDKGSETE